MKCCLHYNLRQDRIIEEFPSTTFYHWYLGNKYLLHAYFSSITTSCSLFHGMDILIWKSCGSCKDFNETFLLQISVSWDECILLGTYKIMIMILLSHICQFSNLIVYQFLNKLTCAILMKLQICFFLLVSFFVILVAFLKAS
jgi:hypothetical protein